MYKEVIIVEGRDDTRRLKEVFGEIETFETGGSALDETKLAQIEALQKHRGIIVFTDPDFPGQKIRQTISNIVPDAKHAYLDKANAKPKSGKGLGVEHANAEVIKKALKQAMTPAAGNEQKITQAFLVQLDLIGHAKSKQKREWLASRLGIGYVNGKQLMHRLNLFGISEEQVLEVFEKSEN
ncbi:MAG: ribonuclease M5 [Turicibacter sp.]|nr:ribonuclease M5 [Turicibacter sp.]